MTRVSLILCAVLSVSALAVSQQKIADSTAAPPREAFDPQRDAENDIHEATLEATRTGRRILLDVGGEWCIWCKRLDAFFGSHPKASELLHANFVVVKVNYSKDNPNEKVLSRFPKIPGYPHFFVLDARGTLVLSQDTGLLEEGKGYSEVKVMAFLAQWTPAKDVR